jgi:hypothetical protein
MLVNEGTLRCRTEAGDTMVLDLNNAKKLVELITSHCSAHGRVASVEVHHGPTPFALIEMAQREQTEKVASQYQGSIFGNTALVRLEQKGE